MHNSKAISHGVSVLHVKITEMTKEKASNIVDLLKEFTKNSSSPSLSRVSTARCLTEKIFWMCIGITATVGAAYHLYTIICTYVEHNYYTSITNDFEEPLQVGRMLIKFIYSLKKDSGT